MFTEMSRVESRERREREREREEKGRGREGERERGERERGRGKGMGREAGERKEGLESKYYADPMISNRQQRKFCTTKFSKKNITSKKILFH
jgi:hypothetical protein